MERSFNVFVDEVKNVVSNYPVEFADILEAPDITTKTYRDVEKAFLRIPVFNNRKIVFMTRSYGSEFSTPPQFGQDTPLQNDLNIYILTDKNDLITTQKVLQEKDKNVLKFLKMFIDMSDMFMSSKKSSNSWSYLDRKQFSKGVDEYLPLNIKFIEDLLEKYKYLYPTSSSASGGPPVSSGYSEQEINIIKGDGDIDLFKIDISEFLNYEDITESNRFFKIQELGERIRDLMWSKDINMDRIESFDELFRELKKGGRLKKTRRKSKRRNRKTKMRKRR